MEPFTILFSDLTFVAPRLSSNCSMVRGPMMGLVMLGCSLHQANASCPRVYPFSVVVASTTSATAKGSSVKWLRPMRLGSRPYLDPSGDACSLRYLPVRKPPASGDHGVSGPGRTFAPPV